jgi:hypothetical protein
MVGNENILFVFIMWVLIHVAVPDTDDEEPYIGPITAQTVNNVTAPHFAKKRGNNYG